MKHENPVKTRQIDLDGEEALYAWLRDTANEVLAADPEWQAWEQSIEEAREAAIRAFPFLSDTKKLSANKARTVRTQPDENLSLH